MISSTTPGHVDDDLGRYRRLLMVFGLSVSCVVSFLATGFVLDYQVFKGGALYHQRSATQVLVRTLSGNEPTYSLNFLTSSDDHEALEEGWMLQKGLGALSTAETARLAFVIEGLDAPVQEGAIALKLKPYLIPTVIEEQTLVARVNGGPEQVFDLNVSESTVFVTFPGSALGPDHKITLDFRFPTAKSPLELGVSADPTKVSTRLTSLSVRVLQPDR